MSDWRDDAACVDNPSVQLQDFFPEDLFPYSSHDRDEHIERLRAICNSCLVRSECRQWAEDHKVTYGFVGGETAAERIDRWKPHYRSRSKIPRPVGGSALP